MTPRYEFHQNNKRYIVTPRPRIASLHVPRCAIIAERSRDVPPEWEALLRRHSPISRSSSHLIFKWHHVIGMKRGEQRDRSRWTLWQVQPDHAIPAGIRAMLQDRPPRCLPASERPGRYAFVDDWQWEYYQEHRGYPRVFWILQGPPGGHPAGYTTLEIAQFKAMGEPTDPPPVGAMKYRPFDIRVIHRIQSYDLLLRAQQMLERLYDDSRIHADLREEFAQAESSFRQIFLDWFDGMIQPSSDFLTWFSRRKESQHHLRPASRTETIAALELRDTFLATGMVPMSHPLL